LSFFLIQKNRQPYHGHNEQRQNIVEPTTKKPVMNDHSLTKANQLKNWDAKLLA